MITDALNIMDSDTQRRMRLNCTQVRQNITMDKRKLKMKPKDIKVGDTVELLFDNKIWEWEITKENKKSWAIHHKSENLIMNRLWHKVTGKIY